MKKLAVFSLFMTAFLWGTGFLFTKDLLNAGIHPLGINFIRFFIAALALMIVFGKYVVKSKKETIVRGIILGVFLFLGFFFQTIGMASTSISNASFITTTNVVWVSLISYLFYQGKMSIKTWIGTGLTLVGVYLLSVKDGLSALSQGDLLVMLCAFMFAWHIVLTTILGKKEDARVLTSIQIAVASVLSLFAWLMNGKGVVVPPIEDTRVWLLMIYLGVFPTLIAFFLQTWGQKRVKEHSASLILTTEAVFATLLAWVFLKEMITLVMFVGMVFIFLAIVLIEMQNKEEEHV